VDQLRQTQAELYTDH